MNDHVVAEKNTGLVAGKKRNYNMILNNLNRIITRLQDKQESSRNFISQQDEFVVQ